MQRILIVDDEEDICEVLQFNLQNAGYDADVAYSAEEALMMSLEQYDLFLFDVMMDRMSGYALAAELRKQPQLADKPIVFVTARDSENDLLTGFSVGADDYIAKPFRINEVLARVKAILRRSEKRNDAHPETKNCLVFEELTLSLDSKRASIAGEDISLTKKEFEVLYMLLDKQERVFSREEILSRVWPDDAGVLERSIDVSVARLRKKLGRYASYIISRSGYGYCFTTKEKGE